MGRGVTLECGGAPTGVPPVRAFKAQARLRTPKKPALQGSVPPGAGFARLLSAGLLDTACRHATRRPALPRPPGCGEAAWCFKPRVLECGGEPPLSKRKPACARQRPPCRAVYHPGQGGLGTNRRRVAPSAVRRLLDTAHRSFDRLPLSGSRLRGRHATRRPSC